MWLEYEGARGRGGNETGTTEVRRRWCCEEAGRDPCIPASVLVTRHSPLVDRLSALGTRVSAFGTQHSDDAAGYGIRSNFRFSKQLRHTRCSATTDLRGNRYLHVPAKTYAHLKAENSVRKGTAGTFAPHQPNPASRSDLWRVGFPSRSLPPASKQCLPRDTHVFPHTG